MCPFFLLVSAESDEVGFLPRISWCEEGSLSFIFSLLREWWVRKNMKNEGVERLQEIGFPSHMYALISWDITSELLKSKVYSEDKFCLNYNVHVQKLLTLQGNKR